MKNFLVIDGNSIMNRAFYGVMHGKMLSTKDGIYTNALYGFLNIYFMVLEKINFDYSAVAFDLNAPTFRHKMFDKYKAGRKAMPDELKTQMPIIKDILNAMNIPIFEIEGFEADDILGTVAESNQKKDIKTYILTGDRDSFQLISDKTYVIIPTTGFGKTEYNIYDPKMLMENYQILPYQVIEMKAIMGDSSDNIPGVRGIGEKTATLLINKYQNIDNIYKNIDSLEVGNKIKQNLAEDKEIAYKSKELATIKKDVPIVIDYSKCTITDPNKIELLNLFKKLEFNKFILKLNLNDTSHTLDSASSIEDIEISSNNSSNNDKAKQKIIDKIKSKANILYVDDTNIDSFRNVLLKDKISYYLYRKPDKNDINISKNVLAIYDYTQDLIYIVPQSYPKFNTLLKEFANSKCPKLGYNIKPDLLYIFDNICENVQGFNYDIMVAYYLMDSNRSNYDILYIFNDIYGLELKNTNTVKMQQISMFDNLENIQDNKFKLDSDEEVLLSTYLKGIFYSYDDTIKTLKKLNMYDLFNTVEMPLTETLAYMEHTGMYIDLNSLNQFDSKITEEISVIEEDVYKIAGQKFNINSTKQLGNILFDVLKLPVKRKNKTGYSTDKEVLDALVDEHPIVTQILNYRQLIKLKTTYVDGLKSKIASDGRIHTTFMQTVASTGRISSVEPNLQNIPVRLELGKNIRKFFVGQNQNLIVDGDYSQIELRVLADMSNDTAMIDAFNHNIDIHKVTASQVFNTDLDKVTPEMRSKAKAVNFGIVYGISEFGLAKNISVTRSEAKKYITSYLDKYSGIRNYMQDIIKKAQEDGYVTTLFNRRRYIPELKQKNKNIIEFGKRVAMNTPIQGSAADIIKLAMNKIYRKLKLENLKSRLIMQVHDELIIESPPDEVEIVKKLMKDCMENIIKLKVPLNIDLNVGKSWYDTK